MTRDQWQMLLVLFLFQTSTEHSLQTDLKRDLREETAIFADETTTCTSNGAHGLSRIRTYKQDIGNGDRQLHA